MYYCTYVQCVELKVELKCKIKITQGWEEINECTKLYGTYIICEKLCYYLKVDYDMIKYILLI